MTWTYLIGWSLVHFLWQGALVVTGCAVVLALAGNRSPVLRYAVSVGALALMAVLPMATGMWLAQGHGRAGVTVETAEAAETAGTAATGGTAGAAGAANVAEIDAPRLRSVAPSALGTWLRPRLERAMPSLVFVWLAGVLALSLRLLGGWAWSRRLTIAGVRPAGEQYLAMLHALAVRLRVTRPVRLLESTLVQASPISTRLSVFRNGWSCHERKPFIAFSAACWA